MHSDDRLVTVINTTDKTTKDRLYKSANSLHRLGFCVASCWVKVISSATKQKCREKCKK